MVIRCIIPIAFVFLFSFPHRSISDSDKATTQTQGVPGPPWVKFSIAGQTYTIDLTQLRVLDSGFHLTLFSPSSKIHLIIPEIDTTGAQFFEIFYSWKIRDDPKVDVMVLPKLNGDHLFIDINNNEDLTDDGSPFVFPSHENEFTFEIIAPDDSLQRVKILLQRKPDLPDSLMHRFVDANGDLNPMFARFWGNAAGISSTAGKRGTFYFDGRISVRRGILSMAESSYEVGIFDQNNNGLFNDDDDVFLVDLDQDGNLRYPDEAFAPDDVIELSDGNVKISRVDRYGRMMVLESTNETPTTAFRTSVGPRFGDHHPGGKVDDSLWTIASESLDGRMVTLRDYKGKYLLLNFWGEWCKPCLDEIPALIEGGRKYQSKNFHIVSFLRSHNLERAKRIMKEKGMEWPQLILTDALEKKLRIRSYPTNILILPGGTEYIRVGGVSSTFFETHIR